MARLRVGLIQLSVGDDAANNLPCTERAVREAAREGVDMLALPEMTNVLCADPARLLAQLSCEAEDATLARLRDLARGFGVWILVGSLALLAEGRTPSDVRRAVNRSFLLRGDGAIVARYDKIHLYDAEPRKGEVYCESASYLPGAHHVLAETPWGAMGMSVCYDVRFPHMYRALARAGARLLAVPAAFTVETGRAHWKTLLRARAIENGCFVLAPAQCGVHRQQAGLPKRTWGHSMVVDPWGRVLAEGAAEPCILHADLDLSRVAQARAAIPSLFADPPAPPSLKGSEGS